MALLIQLHATPLPARAHACPAPAVADTTTPHKRELVVLVHGMGRTSLSMLPLARALEHEGYNVFNWGYSSTCCTVSELGAELARELRARGRNYERVHFVGHSLGTVIIRSVLTRDSLPITTGRVVMYAPPNRGSHEADRSARWLGWLYKPLPELRTQPTSTARTLTLPAGTVVGVIAGRYDGKVSIEETRLDAGAAHVVVPATHTFLMLRRDVHRLTKEFLHNGCFTTASTRS